MTAETRCIAITKLPTRSPGRYPCVMDWFPRLRSRLAQPSTIERSDSKGEQQLADEGNHKPQPAVAALRGSPAKASRECCFRMFRRSISFELERP